MEQEASTLFGNDARLGMGGITGQALFLGSVLAVLCCSEPHVVNGSSQFDVDRIAPSSPRLVWDHCYCSVAWRKPV